MPAVQEKTCSKLEKEFGSLYDAAYERWKEEHPELRVNKPISRSGFELRDGISRATERYDHSPVLLLICYGALGGLITLAIALIFDVRW